MKVEIRAQFTLFGQIKHEGDWYIAHCPPLDISTQGKTFLEAKNNLIEASELFFISCFERGTLDQALRELGFIPMKQYEPRQAKVKGSIFRMEIPIPFGLEKNLPCHA